MYVPYKYIAVQISKEYPSKLVWLNNSSFKTKIFHISACFYSFVCNLVSYHKDLLFWMKSRLEITAVKRVNFQAWTKLLACLLLAGVLLASGTLQTQQHRYQWLCRERATIPTTAQVSCNRALLADLSPDTVSSQLV